LEQQNDDTGIALHDQESKLELKNTFKHRAAILKENYLIMDKVCLYPKHVQL
jgi:hypothetical protein